MDDGRSEIYARAGTPMAQMLGQVTFLSTIIGLWLFLRPSQETGYIPYDDNPADNVYSYTVYSFYRAIGEK